LNKIISQETLSQYLEIFKNSMSRCFELFGDKGFVKVSYNEEIEQYEYSMLINKPLFSAFSVILANRKYEEYNFKNYSHIALAKLSQKLKDPNNFMSISTSTNSKSKVENYFRMCQEVIDECLSEI